MLTDGLDWNDMVFAPAYGTTQLVVFDTRIAACRCVTIRKDGRWQEENGRTYDPQFAPFYTRWLAVNDVRQI